MLLPQLRPSTGEETELMMNASQLAPSPRQLPRRSAAGKRRGKRRMVVEVNRLLIFRRRLDFFVPHYCRSLFLFFSFSFQNAMGRHNGGTRSKGGNLAVGAALTNKQKGKIRPGAPKGSTEPTSHRHTTEAPASGLQSMLDATDLSELMDMVRRRRKEAFSLSFQKLCWMKTTCKRSSRREKEPRRERGRREPCPPLRKSIPLSLFLPPPPPPHLLAHCRFFFFPLLS